MSRPHRHWDAEELFGLWYNGGARRTHPETVAAWAALHPEEEAPSVKVCERYSGEDDWKGRGRALDAEAREAGDSKLAELIRRQRADTIRVSVHMMRLFAQRFTLPEGDPARLDAKDVDHRTWLETAKLFELLTGGATERVGVEGETVTPEELDAELEEIEIRALQREAERTPAEIETVPVLDGAARRLVRNPTAPEPEKVPA